MTFSDNVLGAPRWTYFITTQTSATVETYDYYIGGDPSTKTGGTLAYTVEITYTDAGKKLIASGGNTVA